MDEKEKNDSIKLTIEQAPETEKVAVEKSHAHDPKAPTDDPAEHPKDAPTLKEVIQEQATEDDAPLSKNFSLRKILGGDILSTAAIRRQVWLFLLITLFVIIYISNRYSCQKDFIEIDRLQQELQDAKYRALSSNSELTEVSRESHVLDMLKNVGDSTLHIADQPPYIIQVPDDEVKQP